MRHKKPRPQEKLTQFLLFFLLVLNAWIEHLFLSSRRRCKKVIHSFYVYLHSILFLCIALRNFCHWIEIRVMRALRSIIVYFVCCRISFSTHKINANHQCDCETRRKSMLNVTIIILGRMAVIVWCHVQVWSSFVTLFRIMWGKTVP